VTDAGALADVEFCYLTTTGRTTGRDHRIEIWFVTHDEGVFVLSGSTRSDWYRNLMADPRVTLEIAGDSRATVAHPVDPTDPANHIVRPAIRAKYQAGSTGEDLSGWSRSASLVRIEWPARPE